MCWFSSLQGFTVYLDTLGNVLIFHDIQTVIVFEIQFVFWELQSNWPSPQYNHIKYFKMWSAEIKRNLWWSHMMLHKVCQNFISLSASRAFLQLSIDLLLLGDETNYWFCKGHCSQEFYLLFLCYFYSLHTMSEIINT